MNIERMIREYAEQAQLCWQAPRNGGETWDYSRRSLFANRQDAVVTYRILHDGISLYTPHRSGMTTEVQSEAERMQAANLLAAYRHGPIPQLPPVLKVVAS